MEENIIKSFIGKNQDVIYSKINKKFSFNIYCMLFTTIYFIYRKMYLVGLISFILQSIIAEFVDNVFISLICFVIWGFAFYPLYKLYIDRKIKKIDINTITDEELKKKGGTSIVSAIIVPLILVIVLIASFGMKIMDSASNAKKKGNESNTSKIYSYNGVNLTYMNNWQEEYVGVGGQKYRALCEKDGDIIIIPLQVADVNDGMPDYSLSSVRQEFYDALIEMGKATYAANGIEISKQTNSFRSLDNDLYYAYHEIRRDGYVRSYTILNSKNNTAASLMIISDKSITDLDEKNINEILKNIKF